MKRSLHSPVTRLPKRTRPKQLLGRWITLVLLTGATLGLASCNTVDGVGQDIEAAGDSISDAAN